MNQQKDYQLFENGLICKRRNRFELYKKQYPDKIPVVFQFEQNKQVKEFQLLINKEYKLTQIIKILKKQLKLKKDEAIYLSTNGIILGQTINFQKIYDAFKNEDGFFYIKIEKIQAFGIQANQLNKLKLQLMSYMILKKRKIRDLLDQEDQNFMIPQLLQKKTINFRGQTILDFQKITSKFKELFPTLTESEISQVLIKNQDDFPKSIHELKICQKQKDLEASQISEEDWEEKNENSEIKFLMKNPTISETVDFLKTLEQNIKNQNQVSNPDQSKKIEAANFILKEGVKIQKKILEENEEAEKNIFMQIQNLNQQIQTHRSWKLLLLAEIQKLKSNLNQYL